MDLRIFYINAVILEFAFSEQIGTTVLSETISNSSPSTNNIIAHRNFTSTLTTYMPKEDDTSFHIAQEYIKQINQNIQQKQRTSIFRKNRRVGLVGYMNDVDVLNNLNSVDEGSSSNFTAGGSKSIKKLTIWHPSKIKATDYVILSPVVPPSSVRSGKNNKEFGIVNGIGGEGDDTGYTVGGIGKSSVLTSIKSTVNTPTYKQVLDPKRVPTASLQVNSNNTSFYFEVDEGAKDNYFISVLVEKMNCRTNGANETLQPKLHILGGEQELSICKTIDHSLNNYQSVEYLTNGDKAVTVRTSGVWNANVSAVLAVSIYTEASQCICPKDHFCCGQQDTACNYHGPASSGGKYRAKHMVSSLLQQLPQRSRCIPKFDGTGSTVMCNGHPNCGFHCNPDENAISCLKEGGEEEADNDYNGDNCSGYYCQEYESDRFLLTVLLLILFCVFVPFCIFICICSRKDISRDLSRRGRCPLPLEIVFCPFSISADETNSRGSDVSTAPTIDSSQNRREARRRGELRRHFNRRTEGFNSGRGEGPYGVDNSGYQDDLPPPYSECCNDKDLFPNPPKTMGFPENNRSFSADRNTNARREATIRTLAAAFQLQPIQNSISDSASANHTRPETTEGSLSYYPPSYTQNTVASSSTPSTLTRNTPVVITSSVDETSH